MSFHPLRNHKSSPSVPMLVSSHMFVEFGDGLDQNAPDAVVATTLGELSLLRDPLILDRVCYKAGTLLCVSRLIVVVS
jgi:hypothetical protein